ncbi:MAG TPA: DUF998 domain-containing protein, partial [Solirubrobacterales bacterium]|nr:DUF998 domain-containing protein [Solirubrobacterales bacterium]
RISEYVNGDAGWLMTIGFAAWAVSLLATAVVARGLFSGPGVSWALVLAAFGMVLVACFATQTSAGELLPGDSLTLSGRLHDRGSGLVMIGLTIAGALALRRGGPRRLRRRTLLLLLAVLPVLIALIAIGDDVDGIRQRLLVGTGCAWQLLLLMEAVAGDRVPAHASSTSGPPPSIR